MADNDTVWAIGLMSGTSLDGLDGALIRTDGMNAVEFGPAVMRPMPDGLAERLRGLMHGQGDWLVIERDFTHAQIPVVEALLRESGLAREDVACIGFHGQTIQHRPAEGITWQIGNGALLAEQSGIPTVSDFRRRDVAAGGQGAPLVPLYHAALAANLEKPLAVLNIGGIGNVTWIGPDSETSLLAPPNLLAFDTGPGNALLNDWMKRHTGFDYDDNGQFAATGKANEDALAEYLSLPFFAVPPPKSLDRHDLTLEPVAHLSPEDGAATLTLLTALSVARANALFSEAIPRWLVCGGGRHNGLMMESLRRALNAAVEPVEAVGWRGDALEAEAFAYLAVRLMRGLPISLPTTTGVSRAVTGGAFYSA